MAKHGYMDDDYGTGSDRDVDRGRERSWRGESGWRGEGGEWRGERDRDRDGMFQGSSRGSYPSDEERYSGHSQGGGFISRMADEARSWFRNDDDDDDRRSARPYGWGGAGRTSSGYGREHGVGGFQGDYRGGRDQGGFGGSGDYREGRRSFSAHPDDHYLSWRAKQIEALDRDYQEYCREREQSFHQDFESWRNNRQRSQSGSATQTGGAGQSAQGGSTTGGDSDELILGSRSRRKTADAGQEPQSSTQTDSLSMGATPQTEGDGRR